MERAKHRFWSGTFDYYTHTPTRSAKEVLLYPLETGMYRMATGHETERRSYPSFEIMHLSNGSMDVIGGKTHAIAQSGDFVLIDCYAYHRYEVLTDADVLWLHFDGLPARYYYDGIVKHLGMVFSVDDENSVLEPLRAIYDMFSSGEYINEPIAAKYLTDMLTALLLDALESSSSNSDMRKVMAYINAHLAEPLEVGRLASMTGMRERSFMRAFKRESGYTPHAYVVATRMDRAKQMLANSKAGLQEICAACGYSQPTVFCGAFKSYVGMSPMEYRQRMVVE